MNMEPWLLTGGIFCLGFVIFHLTFWKIFKWREDLASLTFINRAVMQVLNLSLTFAFFIFGYISLFHAKELLTTSLGTSLLLLISSFWIFRAILQIVFFGLKNKLSIIFFIIFVVGFTTYLIPFVTTLQSHL
jgi:hypothetical protein